MSDLEKIFSLKGKTAVVTGGSGKYGKQITLALCMAGAKVVVASRNKEKNEEYVAELKEKGYDVVAEELDLGDEKSIRTLADKLSEEGSIDILVNNAVARVMKNYDDTEGFRKSLDINGTGMYLMHKIFGAIMAKQGKGSIINIGSYMGILAQDYNLYKDMIPPVDPRPDYFFHKAGLTNLTKFMASKFGPYGVRCNVLELGGLFNNQDPLFVERYSAKTFLNRMANDSDIMGIIILLASDASAYITGAAIPVDGGYSAK